MLWGGKTLIPCQSYILSSALGTGSGPAVGDPVSAHQNPRVPFTGLCALPRPWILLLLTQAPVTPWRAVPGRKGQLLGSEEQTREMANTPELSQHGFHPHPHPTPKWRAAPLPTPVPAPFLLGSLPCKKSPVSGPSSQGLLLGNLT